MKNDINSNDMDFAKIMAIVGLIAEIERLEKELELLAALEENTIAVLIAPDEVRNNRQSQSHPSQRMVEIDEQLVRRRKLYSSLNKAIVAEEYEAAAEIKKQLEKNFLRI